MDQIVEIKLSESSETGMLGIVHLKRFWEKCQLKKSALIPKNSFDEEWMNDHGVLNALGVSLEDSLQHIYVDSKSFEEFENWIIAKNSGNISKEKIEQFNALFSGKHVESKILSRDEKVLSKSDLAFFEEHGYVILRNAISIEQARASEKVVWDFLGMNPADPDSWYEKHKERKGIMVQFFHHEILEANRKSEKIHRAYVELFGHDNLLVTTDRVSFNPPETETWKFPGPRLHWDLRFDKPITFGLQGILYLTDTKAEQGALTVVPGFQHKLSSWLNTLPPEADPQVQDLEALGTKAIAANAGDFIIWHHSLPHGSRPNTSNYPRIVQYINWQPVKE
jgi:hypothetical protein